MGFSAVSDVVDADAEVDKNEGSDDDDDSSDEEDGSEPVRALIMEYAGNIR